MSRTEGKPSGNVGWVFCTGPGFLDSTSRHAMGSGWMWTDSWAGSGFLDAYDTYHMQSSGKEKGLISVIGCFGVVYFMIPREVGL